MIEPHIKLKVLGQTGYFTIFWSSLKKADKYEIIKTVPAVSGLFELYFQDYKKKLVLLYVAKAYYGGLQNEIRKRTDPSLEENLTRRMILEEHDCYYRYAISHSYSDLSDVMYFFSTTYFPELGLHEHSGRFKEIYVKEVSPDKIIDI